MRIVLRLLVALVVLIVLLLVGLAIALPRLAESGNVRARIESASTDLLGRPLEYDTLEVGILPPRIELASPRIPGADASAPPLLEARQVDLRISPLPLLGLALVIDSLVIDGLAVEVTRTESGFDLPMAPTQEGSEETGDSGDGADEGGSLFALGIRRLAVRDTSLILVDRRFSPPVRIGLAAVELDARATAVDEPVRLEGQGKLVTGGSLTVDGTTTLDGVVDLKIRLQDVGLAEAAVYVGEGARLDATLTGDAHLQGPAVAPDRFEADLALAADRIVTGTTVVEGPVDIKANLSGDWTRLAGPVSIDASAARVASGDAFVKPAGTTTVVEARLATGSDGAPVLTFDRLELASLQATGRASLGESVTLRLDAAPFEAVPLLALLPAAADTPIAAGSLAFEGFTTQLEPLAVTGALQIEDLRVGLESGGEAVVAGRVVGRGDQIDLEGVTIDIGGERMVLTGSVRELSGELPFSLQLETDGVLRADPLLTGYDPTLKDSIYGPGTVRGELTGRAGATGSDTALLDSLRGQLTLDMGRAVGDGSEGGRIVGFSLLGAVFEGLEKFGQLTHLTSLVPGRAEPDLAAQTDDEFESIQAVFRVHDGVLETKQARLVYSTYAANVRGTIQLDDFALDMNGEVELGSEVATLLGAGAKDGEIVVPVARIGGYSYAPEVSVSKTAITSLGSQLVSKNIAVKSVLGEAEKVVPEAGRILEKGLGGLFGGGRKRSSPPPNEPAPPAPAPESVPGAPEGGAESGAVGVPGPE